jgi:elongation factor G
MGPNEDHKEGLTFVNDIFGGSVPKEFVPAVEKGFKEAIKTGVLAGYPMDGLKVYVYMTAHTTRWIQTHFHLNWQQKWHFRKAAKTAGPQLARANHETRSNHPRRKHR